MFKSPVSIRFWQADSGGIMFFGNAFHLVHDVYESFVASLGFESRDWFENPEWAVPIRHAEADYLRPLKPHESYEARVSIEQVGESSLSLKFTISANGLDHCVAKTVHVFMNKKSLAKMPIPESVRS